MSSHHIVRENQEPALLIEDVHSIDSELLGQLFEWSPTIIANEISYEILHSQGYKVDYVIASHQIISPQEHLETQMCDGTDFISQGISLLLEKNHRAVNILSNAIDVDHLRTYAPLLTIVWLHSDQRSVYISSGFEKWKAKGEYVFLEENAEELSTQGLSKINEWHFVTEYDGFYKINFSNLKPVLLTELI